MSPFGWWAYNALIFGLGVVAGACWRPSLIDLRWRFDQWRAQRLEQRRAEERRLEEERRRDADERLDFELRWATLNGADLLKRDRAQGKRYPLPKEARR